MTSKLEIRAMAARVKALESQVQAMDTAHLTTSSSNSPVSEAGNTSSRSLTRASSFEIETLPSLGTVLVVGGCGFLGHTLVKQLLSERTCTSIAVMSRSPFKNRYESVAYHIGDITNLEHCRSVMTQVKPNVIFNTASPHAYVDHLSVPTIFQVNVTGNANLLRIAYEVGNVSAYVYTSSAPIIAGSGGGYDHADETHPTLVVPTMRKGDPYHVAKAMGDKLVLEANKKNGIRTCTVRPTALYGGIGDGQMIGPVIKALEDGVTNIWMGYNNIDMDVVHVENVARCHVLAAKGLLNGISNVEAPKVDGEAFNVTDDQPSRPLTFFRKYWALCGDKTPLSSVWMVHPTLVMIMAHTAEWIVWALSGGANRPEDLKVERLEFVLYTRTYSVAKARERLGYKPWESTGYSNQDDGIKASIEWYLQPDVHGPIRVGGAASWPETPFKLISNTGASEMVGLPHDHFCVQSARLMAQTHNTIFRALNAIYQQALHIVPGTQDAADFLEYCAFTYDFIHHHQICEESIFFPEIEKATCTAGLMESNVKEHHAMDAGLERLRKYAETTRKETFDGEEILKIIDGFKDAYQQHQHSEIQTILQLHDKIDSKALKKIDGRMRSEAERTSDIFKAAPWVMGCQDRNFILDNQKHRYPNVMFLAPFIVNLFLASRHAGAWRFNPSNGYGKPKPYPATVKDIKDVTSTDHVPFMFDNKLNKIFPSSSVLLVLLLACLLASYLIKL